MCISDHTEDHLRYQIGCPGILELAMTFKTRQMFSLVELRREVTMPSSMRSEIRLVWRVAGSCLALLRTARDLQKHSLMSKEAVPIVGFPCTIKNTIIV